MNRIWILLGSSYDLLEERRKDDVTILFLLYETNRFHVALGLFSHCQ